jgi:hypothetical protein
MMNIIGRPIAKPRVQPALPSPRRGVEVPDHASDCAARLNDDFMNELPQSFNILRGDMIWAGSALDVARVVREAMPQDNSELQENLLRDGPDSPKSMSVANGSSERGEWPESRTPKETALVRE